METLKPRAMSYSYMYLFVINQPLFVDGIPNDGTPVKHTVTVSPAVTAIYSLASVAGIILAFACGVFNFVHRNKK